VSAEGVPAPDGGLAAAALALAALALLAAWAGVHQLVRASTQRGRVLALTGAVPPPAGAARRPDLVVDDLLRRTPPGRWAARHLEASGLPLGVVHLLAVAAVAGVLGRAAVRQLLLAPPTFSLVGAVGGVAAVAVFVRHRQRVRREAFTDQVAELAQVLANLTFAGMAVPYAIAVAADELPEPAAAEVRRLAHALSVGRSLDAALAELAERLPSRQLRVLAVTLTVTNRAGGDLVQALRSTAATLRSRQDARNEVRTMLTSSRANSLYVVLLVPVFVLIVRSIDPLAFPTMLSSPWGIAVFAVVVAMVATGAVLISRVSRIEV